MADNQEEPGKLFVGGLSWTTTEENLRAYFSRYGQVSKCTVMMDHRSGQPRPRGFGFVTFVDPNDADKVVNEREREHLLDGKKIDPKYAVNKDQQDLGKAKVFLGGLAPTTNDQEVEEALSGFGPIHAVDIKRDVDNKCRGFGFATFKDEESAQAAVDKHHITICGKTVEVKKADPNNHKRAKGLYVPNGVPSNGHQYHPDSHAPQPLRGYYNQYASQYYHPQQYAYPQAAYNGSSGAGYTAPTAGTPNGQAFDYSGYQNSRDGYPAQQQYAGYHQQGHYGASQPQGYAPRSQQYNGYPVHQ